tara:strand:+ start:4521 stop:5708 length:1188 start_codon:yes stop_codon:yes gene_type:complete
MVSKNSLLGIAKINKKVVLKNFIIRFLLVAFSSCIGLLVINFLILFLLPSALQKNNFPRSFLRYLPPLARWNYPNLTRNNFANTAIIIGDSYAEGAGDAFLNNEYNYSVGHHLLKLTNYNFKLAANGGSDLLFQLSFLEDSFKNNHSSLKSFQESIGINDNLKIIAFFYEGNDLQSVIYENRIKKDTKLQNIKTSIKKKINKYFPLIYFFKVIIYDTNQNIQSSLDKEIDRSQIFDKDINIKNQICRADKCRNISRIQSAAPDLDRKEIDLGIDLTVNGLIEFKKKFNAKICFVYIPSPATIYSPKLIYPQIYFPKSIDSISAEDNLKKSKYIRNNLNQILMKNNIIFNDSTDYLINKSKKMFIHGKIDQKHFNKEGYEFLAMYTAKNLNNCFDK